MLHRIGMIAGPIIAGFASDALTVAIPAAGRVLLRPLPAGSNNHALNSSQITDDAARTPPICKRRILRRFEWRQLSIMTAVRPRQLY